MDFTEHRCRNCGGQLAQQEDKRWRCPYCASVFEDASTEKHTEDMGKLFDQAKQETISNLRRNLYDATHAEYISSADVHAACAAIKQYLPDDFQANFYEIAVGNNVKQLARAIRRIDVEANIDDIEGIIQFLIRSLQSDYLLELNNLIERAFKNRDLARYEKYSTEVSVEAEKVNLGVYETKFPRQVFVAYSSKDMDKVFELVEVLETQGMKCFVAARNLRHGKGAVENYNQALAEAMDHCQSFVFVSTPNSRSMSCDALSIELPYIQSRDIENAPAEYRNNYKAIPARYKKPRVEYRIGDCSGMNAADAITKEFFDGYEWVYSADEVAQRIMKQLIATPQAAPAEVRYVDMEQKKICTSCGSENNVNAKFCAECGGNEFVNSASELIKLRKMQDDAEKAKREAEEKARREAEERARREAAEKARREAEAKAAEEARRAASASSSTSSYSSSSSTSSYSSSSYKPKKRLPIGAIILIAFFGLAFILTIISTIMNNSEDPGTLPPGVQGELPGGDTGDLGEYSYLTLTSASGGYAVAANPDKIADVPADLVIPDEINGTKIVEIVPGAFSGCSQITSVTVTNNVTKIGSGAFAGCSKIKTMSIPFVGNTDLSEGTEAMFGYIFGTTSYAGGVATKQYYGSSSYQYYEFYLPASLTSVTITNATQLGYSAFGNCSALTEINLNEGIMKVGARAFENCTAIKTISLPGITEISSKMFDGCTALESFTIAEGVTKIGSMAFNGCSGLSRINSDVDGAFVIADNVTSIGSGAFSGCIKLTDLTVPFVGASAAATGTDGHFGYIFGGNSYAGGELVEQSYGSSAYEHYDYYLPQLLRKVTVTKDTDLVYGAFNNCIKLEEIVLHDDLITIGDRAFESCSALKEINLPSITTINSRAFMGCTSLESFTINPQVKTIGSSAFKGCTGLLRINSEVDGEFIIPDTVTTIGNGALAGCSSLTKLSIPFVGMTATSSVREGHFGYIFGSTKMAGTTLVEQNYNTSAYEHDDYYIPSKLYSVSVTSTQSLAFGAFHNCTMLTEINLHDNITSVGGWAFYNCSSITEINLPNILEISLSMMSGCTSLESFTIGDSVTSIGRYAFSGCLNLSRINSEVDGTFYIKDNVKTIGQSAFNGCIKVKTLILPYLGSTVSSSGREGQLGYIFGTESYTGGTATKQYYGSSGYENTAYYIPNSLTAVVVTNCNGISYGAFSSCSRLKNIQINTSAEGIVANRAFEGCSATVAYKNFQSGDENNSELFAN